MLATLSSTEGSTTIQMPSGASCSLMCRGCAQTGRFVVQAVEGRDEIVRPGPERLGRRDVERHPAVQPGVGDPLAGWMTESSWWSELVKVEFG